MPVAARFSGRTNLEKDAADSFTFEDRKYIYPNELSFIVGHEIDSSCQQIREIS